MSNVRIQLREKQGADKTNQDVKRGDVVSWHNQTSRGRTITFAIWPFVEPPQPIMVAAKAGRPGESAEFTVADSVTTRAYAYLIEPSINPDDGPPDEPAILVGD
ncbi:MAG TPA: hypothetical protein VFP10_12655 [Candidatus Eisenbacteria bacterium]|nr:hypothetical protein [Candidatus Eisenbacteria bacterium]